MAATPATMYERGCACDRTWVDCHRLQVMSSALHLSCSGFACLFIGAYALQSQPLTILPQAVLPASNIYYQLPTTTRASLTIGVGGHAGIHRYPGVDAQPPQQGGEHSADGAGCDAADVGWMGERTGQTCLPWLQEMNNVMQCVCIPVEWQDAAAGAGSYPVTLQGSWITITNGCTSAGF
jgi:hypothetical protein